MKGKSFILGMVSIMLIVGFVFVGCNTGSGGGTNTDGTTPTTLEGTWTTTGTGVLSYFKFEGSNFEWGQKYNTYSAGVLKGTFTLTDTIITASLTHTNYGVYSPENASSWTTNWTSATGTQTINYSKSGNNLVISGFAMVDGTYTKQ
ncbi:hypothetical protein AGMMS50268_33910 [Spirochaetia bacterium]|nr:hypothetical protein AGMMS50268_33910 [Spirochaetia bacterium]